MDYDHQPLPSSLNIPTWIVTPSPAPVLLRYISLYSNCAHSSNTSNPRLVDYSQHWSNTVNIDPIRKCEIICFDDAEGKCGSSQVSEAQHLAKQDFSETQCGIASSPCLEKRLGLQQHLIYIYQWKRVCALEIHTVKWNDCCQESPELALLAR